jgi:hypothetical protein
MIKDPYTRVLLTIIAISLAILALHTAMDMFSTPVQAQRPINTVIKEGPAVDVLLIRDFPIDGLKNVYVLGDSKTFIVQKTSGIAVYRVDNVPRESQ